MVFFLIGLVAIATPGGAVQNCLSLASLVAGFAIKVAITSSFESRRCEKFRRAIDPIASPFGLELTNASKQKILANIQQDEARLQTLGFVRYKLPDYPAAYSNTHEAMKSAIESYGLHLHLTLPALPQ